MSLQQLKTTNILKEWMDTINSIISSLSGYYTKEELDKLLADGLSAAEYVWTADMDYAAGNTFTLTDFTYPRGLKALRVSLDGFVLSEGVHYEEVITDETSVYSDKIKLLVPVDATMVLDIWVTPIMIALGLLEDKLTVAQSSAKIAEESVAICEESATIAQQAAARAEASAGDVTPFRGATSTEAGAQGLVPQPAIADVNKYLKGDGTWSVLEYPNFITNLSVSGNNITVTKNDGTTSTLTTQDTVYTLEPATEHILGGVSVGSNISISSNGEISLTKANVTSALGFTPISSIPTATATVIGGVMVGANITNTGGSISLTKANVTSALGFTPPTKEEVIAGTYILPQATSSVMGGVTIGSNISVSAGKISLTKANVTAALGYVPPTQDTVYTLPQATSSVMGGVKVGAHITNTNGTISVTKTNVVEALGYTPLEEFIVGVASDSATGTVTIGENLTIENGILSLSADNVRSALGYTTINSEQVPIATDTTLGGVIVGSNISVLYDGTISLNDENIYGALGYTPLNSADGVMEGNLVTKGSFSEVTVISDVIVDDGTTEEGTEGETETVTEGETETVTEGDTETPTSTVVEVDLSTASVFITTITKDTTFSIINVPVDKSAVFTMLITNGGSYVVTYPSNIKWSNGTIPELTTIGEDVLTFFTADGGITWFGSPSVMNATIPDTGVDEGTGEDTGEDTGDTTTT